MNIVINSPVKNSPFLTKSFQLHDIKFKNKIMAIAN
jgi:hypothetical protein